MNTICTACGTTLQSNISRDYGMCGACRSTEELRQLERERQELDRASKPSRKN